MKFGKSLLRCADMSDPEWAIFWVNYKLLKKKIKGIEESSKGVKNQTSRGRQNGCSSNPADISKNVAEVEFFRVVRAELKKTRSVIFPFKLVATWKIIFKCCHVILPTFFLLLQFVFCNCNYFLSIRNNFVNFY